MSPETKSGRSLRRGRWICLALPLGYFAIVLLFFPFRFIFEFDPDEGINLIKSVLVTRGHDLYTEIWSDQPPNFTYLIAAWIKVFGVNLTSIRLLILVTSCVILWAVAEYLFSNWGPVHAIAGALVVILLPQFLPLSVSIMVGLPAIALALLSFLALSAWHEDRRSVWIALSGLLLGVSVMTKLFTASLAPVFLVGSVLQQRRSARESRSSLVLIKPGMIWLTGFIGTMLLAAALFVSGEGAAQLLTSHLVARTQEWPENLTISDYLAEALPFIGLALIGGWLTVQRRSWSGVYLIVWSLSSYVLLSLHSPIWHHHQLLITIPLAILGGIAIGEFIAGLSAWFRDHAARGVRWISTGLTGVLIPFLVVAGISPFLEQLDFRLPNLAPPEARSKEIQAAKLLEPMWDYAEATNLIITDRPMFAVRINKPVPPYLAALTGKRIRSGELTESDIIAAIKQFRPEQVALARFELPQVEAYLRENYRFVFELTDHRLYVRSDL